MATFGRRELERLVDTGGELQFAPSGILLNRLLNVCWEVGFF